MKTLLLSISILLLAAGARAQDAPSGKAMALKLSLYLIDLSDKRTDIDGPYQAITGELAQTNDGLEILKTRNLEKPDGVTQQYLFREPRKWPAFAANLSPEGAQAMKAAITEILPAEKPAGLFKSRSSSNDKSSDYFIVHDGKTIGSLSIRNDSGKGMLVMNSGY